MEREQAKEIIHILTDLQKQHDPDCGYRNYKYYEEVISNIYNQNKQLQDKLDKVKELMVNYINDDYGELRLDDILSIIESESGE